jgi:hypothetical protein
LRDIWVTGGQEKFSQCDAIHRVFNHHLRSHTAALRAD